MRFHGWRTGKTVSVTAFFHGANRGMRDVRFVREWSGRGLAGIAVAAVVFASGDGGGHVRTFQYLMQ